MEHLEIRLTRLKGLNMTAVASIKNVFSSFLLLELLKGMALTGRHFWQRKITVQFPEEKTPQSPRFRGLHALRRYDNGEERCIDRKSTRLNSSHVD